MTPQLPILAAPDLDREIDALVRAARRANGPVMALVNRLGGSVVKQLAVLPAPVRAEVERLTAQALMAAHGVAGIGGEAEGRGTLAAVLATGAAGGAAAVRRAACRPC